MFADALEEAGARDGELVGVGMGLPGPVHRPSGQLGDSTILPGWVGVRAADAVSAALGHVVEVENDANLGALGEWMWGAGRGAHHMAYVKASTGIGAGFIVAGQPYVGAGGTAGELGHTVIEPGGPICRCGNRGCLETIAGAPAILGSLREVHSDDLTLAEAVAYARRGDAGCQRAIADAGHGHRHRRRDAVQPLQPAPGRGRRRPRRGRASYSSRRCASRCAAARSARPRTTSTSSRASSASARRCSAPSRSCSAAARWRPPLDTHPFG